MTGDRLHKLAGDRLRRLADEVDSGEQCPLCFVAVELDPEIALLLADAMDMIYEAYTTGASYVSIPDLLARFAALGEPQT